MNALEGEEEEVISTLSITADEVAGLYINPLNWHTRGINEITKVIVLDNYTGQYLDVCKKLAYYRKYCDRRFESIKFSKVEFNEAADHLKCLFQKSEVIELEKCFGEGIATVLDSCKCIKRFESVTDKGLPHRTIPMLESKLKSLDYTIDNENNVDELQTFFSHNPNIRQFTCHFNFDLNAAISANWFQKIFASSLNCDELFYDVQGSRHNNNTLSSRNVRPQLKPPNKPFKRVAVKLLVHMVEELSVLVSATKSEELHLACKRDGFEYIELLKAFDHVNSLFLWNVKMENVVHGNVLVDAFPNIERLHFVKSDDIEIDWLVPLVRYAPHLKKMVFHETKLKGNALKFDKQRSKLNGSCKLVVYLDINVDSVITNEYKKIESVEFAVVHIKTIDDGIIINPFYPYSMKIL